MASVSSCLCDSSIKLPGSTRSSCHNSSTQPYSWLWRLFSYSHSKVLTLNYLGFLISRNDSWGSLIESKLMLDSLCLKTLRATLPSSHPKCRMERRLRGSGWPQSLLSWRSRRLRRWSIRCWRKGPRILASDRTLSPKGISPALSNAAPPPPTSCCSSKGLFPINVWKFLLQLSRSPSFALPNNYSAAYTGPQIQTSGQSKRSRDCWLRLRRKLLAKGVSPLRCLLSFELGFIWFICHHLGRKQEGSPGSDCTWCGSHWAGCLPACPVLLDGGYLLNYQAEGQPGVCGPHEDQEDLHYCHLHTH